jgi:hypothetical protein
MMKLEKDPIRSSGRFYFILHSMIFNLWLYLKLCFLRLLFQVVREECKTILFNLAVLVFKLR